MHTPRSVNKVHQGGSTLSVRETVSLSAVVLLSTTIIARAILQGDGAPLVASLAVSGLAFSATYAMVRWLGPSFVRVGLRGVDMSKTQRRELPECMGAVVAVVYVLCMICFIPFPFYKDIVAATSGGGNRDVVIEEEAQVYAATMADHNISPVDMGRLLHRFPHNKLASYLSAIMSLQSIAILGIGDDLFDIRWRHKLFIPAIAAIPLLAVYFVDFGVTSIVVPTPLQPFLGDLLDMGILYYVYMAAIAIFSPNSINILAGINGIEVSQSLVIAGLLAFNDALYLTTSYPHPATDSHLFSLYFLLPFIGASLALLRHNWYPARVFVGDTFCYFAGMVFVVVSILGHFTKTLALLLVPQVFNFVYSAPQLFHIIPCPRHRMPRFNARSGLLEPSVTVWSSDRQPRPAVAAVMRLLARCRLLMLRECEEDEDVNRAVNGTAATATPDRNISSSTGSAVSSSSNSITKSTTVMALPTPAGNTPRKRVIHESSNLTLINLWLVWRGPLREDRLAIELTLLQLVTGLLGLFVRHRLAILVFRHDNRGSSF